jgi:NAD(P)-dependent dehydrogenase (short-subunit alcohol dehydrogenase family)
MYPELARAQPDWRYQPAPDELAGRTILVTGAGDGIGRAAARTFATFGANVVLLGRTQAKLEAVYDDIVTRTRTDPAIAPCDLATTSADGWGELADMIVDHYGRLDGLLHNAGAFGVRVPLEHYPLAQWGDVMRVNVDALLLSTQALLPALRSSRDASIVITSSSVGRRGRAYWGAYAVSKFAAEGFAQVLADELEHEGIRVATVNPGATRTAMRASAYPAEDPATVPLPESHMDLYLYLLGPAARARRRLQWDARGWIP